jgi:hypothetical protein
MGQSREEAQKLWILDQFTFELDTRHKALRAYFTLSRILLVPSMYNVEWSAKLMLKIDSLFGSRSPWIS